MDIDCRLGSVMGHSGGFVLSGGFLVGDGRWFSAKLQINLAQEIVKGRGKREMRNCWPFLIGGSFFFFTCYSSI